jgi:hypothetical protein
VVDVELAAGATEALRRTLQQLELSAQLLGRSRGTLQRGFPRPKGSEDTVKLILRCR